MDDNVLTVENLRKRFGPHVVIDNLSFSVARGARTTLFAPSSAGKTTLIHILAGLDPDYQGSFALAASHPVTIFQEPRLFPYLTVEENVFLPARIRGMTVTARLRTGYERWLEVCGLTAYRSHYPYQLSGGMKQKVALVRGFLTEPDFIMMDEPFKSIDLRSKKAIIQHILDTYPQVTILLVTHALEEVPLLAESLLLFSTSRLAEYVVYEVHDKTRPEVDLMEAIYG